MKREKMLRELLAVIHRDGGHHTNNVGLKQSWKDAMQRVSDAYGDISELRMKLEAHRERSH